MVAIVPVNEQIWLGKTGLNTFPIYIVLQHQQYPFFSCFVYTGPQEQVTGKYHGGVSFIHPGNDRNKRGAFLCTVGVGGYI